MIFSYNELKRLANLPDEIKLQNVNDAINSIGFEVENNIPFGDITGMKFGRILEIYPNPNGDRLTVAKIEFDDKIRTIQTTATNLIINKIILAFVPGSKTKKMVIESKMLKGIISEGMLSSLNELGVDDQYLRDTHKDNITFFDDLTDLSIDPVEYLGLRDILIDVDILSNRSDARSYLIMAKELAAYFKTSPLKINVNEARLNSKINVLDGDALSLVMIDSKKDFKISIKEQILLAKSKIKSINDIIDLTNLTLIMAGHPTHAYDKNKVGNDFRASLASTEVVVLGNKKVQLNDNLVIKTGNKIVSVAGVIGLENSGIDNETEEFLIELGRFDNKQIRKSMRTVKLDTLASIQSSKNIGLGTTSLAIKYLSSKLKTFSKPLNYKEQKPLVVDYQFTNASILAGFNITEDTKWLSTIASLEKLDFKFSTDKVEVPNYRYDITSKQDINEEIFRFFGYNSFKPIKPKMYSSNVVITNDYKAEICALGYTEVLTYSLIAKENNIVNPFLFIQEIALKTFVSKQREVIKYSQAPTLLEIIEYNQKRGIKNLSIFSKSMIGDGIQTFAFASTTKSFMQMKYDAIQILPEGVEFKRARNKSLHNGLSATIELNGQIVGWIGKVHPSLTATNAFIVELILNNKNYREKISTYEERPLKKRDITFELAKDDEIITHIGAIDAYEIVVIDEFKKDDINKVTVRLTLNDKQIDKLG